MTQPVFVFVIGVSGSGKTTLSNHLANRLGFQVLEADDFHSEEAKTKMAKGIPLDDSDREPWIQKLEAEVEQRRVKAQSTVIAYSGLKKAHRDRLRSKAGHCVFLKLDLPKNVIQHRLRFRKNHFMPASLLESQMNAFEDIKNEMDVITIQGDNNLNTLIYEIVQTIELKIPNINQMSVL